MDIVLHIIYLRIASLAGSEFLSGQTSKDRENYLKISMIASLSRVINSNKNVDLIAIAKNINETFDSVVFITLYTSRM